MFSRDKGFDGSGWGTFDTNFDTDAAWDVNSVAKVNRLFCIFFFTFATAWLDEDLIML